MTTFLIWLGWFGLGVLGIIWELLLLVAAHLIVHWIIARWQKSPSTEAPT